MRTRDALEPLLQALDMTAGERGGRISLTRGEALSGALTLANLALTDEASGPVRTRSLEARPATARVRFIDEGADYQTGAVVLRAQGVEDGGGTDADLPAVCGAGLARGLAARLLRGAGEDRLTVALGPLDGLRLETGDILTIEGQVGNWRIERITLDETPTAVLTREQVGSAAVEPIEWRPGEAVGGGGAPFAMILDLPPLPGAEDDDRLSRRWRASHGGR